MITHTGNHFQFNISCFLYIIHYTLYIIHYTLYIIHYTLCLKIKMNILINNMIE